MRKIANYVFLIPSFVGLLIFFLIPFFGSFGYVFSGGVENITKTLGNEAFLLAMKNTLIFMAICVPLNIILPLLIANLLKTLNDKAKVFQFAYISPMIVPVASVALFWSILFAPGGTINQVMAWAGLGEVDFLNSGWAILVIALVYLWQNLGYMMVLYIAGLSEIPSSYYESASLDGAGAVKKFFHITIPSLRPVIFFVFVLSIVNCFKVFRQIYLIAGPYPNENIYMLQHYMNNMFSRGNYPMLTTAAFIIALFIIALLLIVFYFNRRAERKLRD